MGYVPCYNVTNFRETECADGQTFAPSSSWDLSNISNASLALFAYASIGLKPGLSNVTIPNTLTTMAQFHQNNSVTPRTLETVIFGACDFSG